jgi:hypothetical protein
MLVGAWLWKVPRMSLLERSLRLSAPSQLALGWARETIYESLQSVELACNYQAMASIPNASSKP